MLTSKVATAKREEAMPRLAIERCRFLLLIFCEQSSVTPRAEIPVHDQLTMDEIEFETRFQPFLAADGSWQDFLWTDDAACNAAVAKA